MSTASPPTPSPITGKVLLSLPNQLTAVRFLLAIVLFVLLSVDEFAGRWLWATALFLVAAVTDILDGYLARRLHLGSTLGRNLDPLVDKILICGAYAFLVPIQDTGVSAWMVVVVFSRELLVTGLRGFMETCGINFGADWGGKLKMWLQCIALIAVFLHKALADTAGFGWTGYVRDVLLYAMIASTVLSGLQYLWKAKTLLQAGGS